MKEKIIQIAVAGTENTSETQSSFVMMALTEDGRILTSHGYNSWSDFTPDKPDQSLKEKIDE